MPFTPRFDEAFAYAHEVHRDHTRKGNGFPYIGHLMGVASIVIDDGGTEDEAIAALLHDAPEDRGGRARLEEIRAKFGDAVAKIVEDCTDSWTTPKAPWAERKTDYAERARTFELSSLRVSAADKVHDSYTILRDLSNIGDKMWVRFNARADDILAYTRRWCGLFREAGGGPLVDELDRIVRAIEREMGYFFFRTS